MTNAQLTTPHRNGLLFLCTGNTARSQMAESFARFIGPAEIQYFSAGTRPGAISLHTVKVMREVGIDIAGQRIKGFDEIPIETITTIISLCEDEECPPLPGGVHHLSWPIQNPVRTSEDDDILQAYRRVRDQIRELVSRLF
jgi:arsenate reductase (thioredoxin)